MPSFARVDPTTLAVTFSYNSNGGPKWEPDDIECTFPFDILSDKAILVNDVITLQPDPAKVSAKAERVWVELRTERDRRLVASDWTQFNDSPLSQDKKSEWAVYRQALRDLPANTTDPTNVTWPTPP